MKPDRRRRGGPIGWSEPGFALALVCAACTTRDVDDVESLTSSFDQLVSTGPVVIPLGDAGGSEGAPLDVYYRSIVAQLQECLVERDLDRLDALLAQHDTAIAPDWAASAMLSFRFFGRSLRVEEWCASQASLSVRGETPGLGADVPLVLRIPAGAPEPLTLPGRDAEVAPTRFLVSARFVDRDAAGSRSVASAQDIVTLLRDAELQSDGLELPFDVPGLPPSGCERVLELTCDVLPGARLLDGEPVPGHRLRLASLRVESFPLGVERVRAEPLATLRAAIEGRDRRHFDHVWLASRFVSQEQREAADELLIGAVRLGPPDLALVAGACLREAWNSQLAPGDRDGWLAWWQDRRRAARADAPDGRDR